MAPGSSIHFNLTPGKGRRAVPALRITAEMQFPDLKMQEVKTTLEYHHRNLMLQGIILTCMLILPAAGASLVSDYQGDPSCNPQEECPNFLDNPYSSGTISSLQAGGDWATSQSASDLIRSATLQRPSTQGTISAWVNQNSMQGNTNGVVTTVEYHQMVTASGQIQNFFFSVSCVL